MVMLKDNHLAIREGDIAAAVHMIKSVGDFASKVEVECSSLKEGQIAIQAGADIVMLDNLDPKVTYQTGDII